MLEVEDNTKQSGTVVQEIQKGYIMKDRLLRPSLVGVTKKREENIEKTKKDKQQNEKKLLFYLHAEKKHPYSKKRRWFLWAEL